MQFLSVRSIFDLLILHMHILTHSHCFEMHFRIPSNGSNVPRLAKYMSLMLILTTIVFVESIFLKLMTKSNRSPPLWMQSFSNFMSQNITMKYFVAAPFDAIELKTEPLPIPNSTSEGNDEEPSVETIKKEEPVNDWIIFCRFMDRIFFIALIICYAKYDGY